MVKIKEININDLIAVAIAGTVVITALIVGNIQEPVTAIITGFLGVIGGYIGGRATTPKIVDVNSSDNEEVENNENEEGA